MQSPIALSCSHSPHSLSSLTLLAHWSVAPPNLEARATLHRLAHVNHSNPTPPAGRRPSTGLGCPAGHGGCLVFRMGTATSSGSSASQHSVSSVMAFP
eukprot:2106099-Rhodomonas_salina.1